MDFLKTCPVCRRENPAHEMVCQRCLADISSVEYRPKGAVAPSVSSPPPPAEPKAVPPVSPAPASREGVASGGQGGAGSGAVAPNADSAVTVVQPRRTLTLKLDNFAFEVAEGAVIGRMETGRELFMQFPGISRQHARVDFDGRVWTIEDLNSTNGTFLNGRQLNPGQKEPLQVGDKLGFSKKVTFEIVALTS